MYTIKLNDGTTIDGLTLERNIFWRTEEITPAMLRGKLSPVTITRGADDDASEDWAGMNGYHEHMRLCYCRPENGKYAIALSDIPDDEFRNAVRDANIEYIAMMTGVDLNV